MPNTEWFREYLAHSRRGGRAQTPTAATAVIRRTQCDAQGTFAAPNLPAGSWVVQTFVTWTVGASFQGGMLTTYVVIAGDEQAKVILSDGDLNRSQP